MLNSEKDIFNLGFIPQRLKKLKSISFKSYSNGVLRARRRKIKEYMYDFEGGLFVGCGVEAKFGDVDRNRILFETFHVGVWICRSLNENLFHVTIEFRLKNNG